MPDTFHALIAEGDSTQYSVDFKDIPHGSLPAGEVLVQVMYSSLNYKDGLAITRRGKVIRKFPMVLGVDLAGKVLESNTGEFKTGDEVLVTPSAARHWLQCWRPQLPTARSRPVDWPAAQSCSRPCSRLSCVTFRYWVSTRCKRLGPCESKHGAGLPTNCR